MESTKIERPEVHRSQHEMLCDRAKFFG